jgi:N-acetylglucosamine kinase-like BadF-type ATPase
MPSDPVTLGGERVAVATVDGGSSSTRAVVLVQGSVLP